jgi:hypothetical protein
MNQIWAKFYFAFYVLSASVERFISVSINLLKQFLSTGWFCKLFGKTLFEAGTLCSIAE